MKAIELYNHLETSFITPEMSDVWSQYMGSISDLLCNNFKKRSMGLVCDFAREIRTVYTAVFPSREVMQRILEEGTQDAMLFVHHPSIWDIRKAPEVFYQMDRDLLTRFKDRRISVFNLHVPLDNFGKYSTSATLAEALSIKPEKPFAAYFGALAGVFGKTQAATVQELKQLFQEAVGHTVRLYHYGEDVVCEGTVAVVAGGGLTETIEEIAQNNVNLLITGITVKNEHSKGAHEYAEKQGINILGGTHYSTEKFACQALVEYFKELGLPAHFIEGIPILEDM